MRVLGIDPSTTSTGVALLDHTTRGLTLGTFRVESKPPKRTKGDKTKPTIAERDARLGRIADLVVEHAKAGTTLALIEEPTYGAGRENGTWDRAGLWWLVVSRLMRLDVPVVQVNSTTRRIWATGHAGAGKSPVSVHMSRLWPDLPLDLCDDEWDAVVFASMGAQHLGWLPVELARHGEQLAKVVWPDFPAGVAA